MADETRIVVAQTVPEFGAVADNRERTLEIVRSHPTADLVVLPELATSGYVFESTDELASMAEPGRGDRSSVVRGRRGD